MSEVNYSIRFEPEEIDALIEDDSRLAAFARLRFSAFASLLEEEPGLVQGAAEPGQLEVSYNVLDELSTRPNAEVAAFMRALRAGGS